MAKYHYLGKPHYSLLVVMLFYAFCNGQNQTSFPQDSASATIKSPKIIRTAVPQGFYGYEPDSTQISQYIRRIAQDKKGNLWFGTVGDGILRYDGATLSYFTTLDGFSGNTVQGIAEDKEGTLWFGTSGGVSKYDGTNFTHFTEKDGLPNNFVFSLLIAKSGTIWVGTDQGVCYYNPSVKLETGSKTFIPFPIPAAVEKDITRGSSDRIIWNMMEDKAGNIWFATNGGGAYCYNTSKTIGIGSKTLTNISKKDGLGSNFLNAILQDRSRNIWFATQHKGVSRFDGKTLTHFTDNEGLVGNEVYTMYEDKAGNIWFSTWGSVSRFNGTTFTTFTTTDGLTNCCVQSIFEDTSGNLWFGSGAGLFRFNGKAFINVTKKGPW